MRIPILLVTFAMACSGCLGGEAPSDREPEPLATPPSDEPAATNSFDAPDLQPGQWWRWEVTGRHYGSFEVTTVVARAGETSYEIAVTDVEALPAHIFHVPPIGVVDRENLAWLAHGEPTDILEFPLTDGKTWTGRVEGQDLEFVAAAVTDGGRTVFDVDGRYVDFDGQGPRFVYDPEMGMISQIDVHYGGDEAFSSARVVASGTGHEGDVRMQKPQDKFYGGSGGLPNTPNPTAQFEAADEKVWLVFACYLGGSTGRFEIAYIPPSSNEETLQCTMTNPGSAPENEVHVFWRSSVPGAWNIAFTVLGPGYADAEVTGVLEQVCHLGPGVSDAPAC